MAESMHAVEMPVGRSRLAPVLQPLEAFLAAESAGGVLLLAAAVVALAWANSPWGQVYRDLWNMQLAVSAGGSTFTLSLEHLVNDGLMTVFFLLAGLEIKRELVVGELASWRSASLPIAAAVGGMVVPAFVYALMNSSGASAAGWGIPMATDIAFAVGIMVVVGRALPPSIKVLLLAVAIVDDLGAVVVIALIYTGRISYIALGVAAAAVAILAALNAMRVHRPLPYCLLGCLLWVAMLASGIHATVAGVLLAFTIPATRPMAEAPYFRYMRTMLGVFARDIPAVPEKITEDQSRALHAMEEATSSVQTSLSRVEHALLKPVNLIVVPVFALANAGVDLRSAGAGAVESPVMWGVLLGLLLGKPTGIVLASWAAIKGGVATLPEGATWRHMLGISALCGIGFTMSLLVGNLAFPEHDELLAASKVGVLAASLASGVLGSVLIWRSGLAAPPMRDSSNDGRGDAR